MTDFLYDAFDFSPSYRARLIEVLRHNTNVEMGGYRLFDGTYAHAVQIPEELADYIIALKRHEQTHGRLRRMLEIGFAAGITNTILNKFFQFDEIVSIDNFSGPSYGSILWANLRFKNLTIISGESASARAIATAKALSPYDLIFIDGDHSYEGVSRDIANYQSMLATGGVLTLHDIATPGTGVPRAWNELVATNKWASQTFVCDSYQRPFGIGLATQR